MKQLGYIAVILVLASTASSASELLLTAQEIDNLGIGLTTPVAAERVNTVDARGRVVLPPGREHVITAFRDGLVVQLDVDVGDEVSKGQALGSIRSPDFLALQSEYIDALNEAALAGSQLARDKQLFDEGIVSQRRLETAEARARVAAAALNEHRRLLELGGMSERGIEALEDRQELTDRLPLRAPTDGVVLELTKSVGERVDTMDMIYRIGDLNELWLEIDVAQENSAGIVIGMKLDIADCVVELPAEIIAIGQAVDPATQTVRLRARVTATGHRLKPGQYVSAQIVTDPVAVSSATVWTLPAAAIVRRGETCYVFVRTEAGFDVREVVVVGSSGAIAYVDGDLTAADQVAASGVSALKALWPAGA